MVQHSNSKTPYKKFYFKNNNLSFNDIKFDLLKIIEPWDGRLEETKTEPVYGLFTKYLTDLKDKKSIYNFSIETTDRGNAITFDVFIQRHQNRSPKKFKIHVGTFQYPWVGTK